MNLQTMEYISALARERSFTRAAEALHITQQSLSGHIAAVEQELGVQLIVRHVPLELTYAGRAFLRHAEAIRQEVLELRQELCDITGEQRGQLRIGSQLQQMLTVRLPRRQAGQIRFAYRKRPYQWQLITAFLHTARTTVQPS